MSTRKLKRLFLRQQKYVWRLEQDHDLYPALFRISEGEHLDRIATVLKGRGHRVARAER